MKTNAAAGKPADPAMLVNVPKPVRAYYALRPDLSDPRQRVVFGTSGHRGSSFEGAFTTDKDGIIPCLLVAEITARLGKDPSEIYGELTQDLGDPVYERMDAPATPEQKAVLQRLSPSDIRVTEVAGEKVQQILTAATGGGNPIGGIKVAAQSGWFAARPSGTEEIY